jgi:hypothetical protein
LNLEKNVSTINATYKLINNILMALNNKRKSGGLRIGTSGGLL